MSQTAGIQLQSLQDTRRGSAMRREAQGEAQIVVRYG